MFATANAKVFTRCQLTRELLKNDFHQRTFTTLIDENIKNDLPCALLIYETKGFKCPDWQFPPSRASPARDKRMILRGKRDTRRYSRIIKSRK
ncbi:Lysozyme-like protein 1 [Operophtera brumata]|uniref:Lysozyme-like protein 1 n=1 Tax=Operophtera brumata TaxID=104452 RepID=A0A0L7KS26_OPEBR|nr:Lysozyme-like protein 1 [Operophtera brumata]